MKDSELLTLGAGAGGNVPIAALVPAWPVIITSPAESTRMLSRPGAEVIPGVTSVAPPTKGAVDDLAGRAQLGDKALKLALHGGLQSAGCHGKIRRIGITEKRIVASVTPGQGAGFRTSECVCAAQSGEALSTLRSDRRGMRLDCRIRSTCLGRVALMSPQFQEFLSMFAKDVRERHFEPMFSHRRRLSPSGVKIS
jgi:hypothetical protein